MAEVPTLTIPDVQPRATPAPDIRLQTPADAFGAGSAGQSLAKEGAAAGQASDANFAYAKAFQDLNNKAASDTAGSEFAAKSREMYNQWSLANPGAKALTPGANGLTPFDQFSQDLGSLRSDTAAKYGLSKVGTSLYDDQTRRLQALVLGDADSYARTQQHAYWISASKAKVETLQNQMTQRPTDLNFLSGIHDQIAQEVAHQQTLTGMSDDEAALQTMNSSSEGLRTVVSGLGVHDPAAAADLQKQYEAQGWISPKDKDVLDRTLHGPLVAQGAAQAATAAFSGVGGAAVTDPDATLNAIMHAETGGQNRVNYKEAAGQKGFTASGYYQITDPTWKTFAPPDVSAKYPRAINAPFEVQQQVAHTILAKEGTAPWAESQPTWSKTVGAVTAPGGSPIAAIEANLPSIQQDAKGRADAWAAKYGIDKSEMEAAVTEHTQQQYAKAKYTYDQAQSSSVDTLLSQVDPHTQEPISDKATLLSIPGMQAAYGNLTTSAQRSVDRQLAMNANAYSPARSQNYQETLGQRGLDPLGFANKDLTTLDLRRADYADLVKRQIETRSQLQKGGMSDTGRWLQSALHTPSVQLTMPKDPGQQALYAGALTTEIEGWQAANPGKQPSLNDYNAMAQKLATSVGGFVGIGGHPVYQDIAAQRATVPENFRAFQRAYAATHGVPQPAEAQIEAAWQKAQH